jgi:hypothetical protein
VSVADVLVFIVGVGSDLSVHLIGEIQVAEIILICLIPFLILLRSRGALRPGLKPIFLLLGFWLIGQVMTDVYRGSARGDWMRGDARIIFFAIDICGLMLLVGWDHRSKLIYWLGYAISSLLAARFQPTDDTYAYPWKFGYAEGTILLVVIVSCYFYARRRHGIVLLSLVGIAGVNLVLNYRSQLLILLVTLAMITPLLPERVGRLRLLPREGTTARVVISVLFVIVAGSTAVGLVNIATQRGLVGEEAQAKNEEQAGAALGMLLGGRPEILVSSRAVMDSPWLGHGSWARDWKYQEMLTDLLAKKGEDVDFNYVQAIGEQTIPAHSELMSAWVSAGILGAIVWFYILWLTVKAFLRVAKTLPPLAPLYIYLLATMTWDIFFSPFGNTRRIFDAMILLIMQDTRVVGVVESVMTKNRYGRGWRRMQQHAHTAMLRDREAS